MSAFHNSPLPSSFDSLLLSKIKMSAFTQQAHQDIPLGLHLPLPPQQSSFQFHHHHLPQTPSPIDYHSPTTAVADTAAFKTHSAASSTLLHSIHRKRKNGDHGSSSASAHSPSQDAIESAGDSKHRKCNNIGSGSGRRAGGGRKPTTHKKLEADEPPAPAGYIHVRARRGQATDSHSLAERIRREKISERMKVLQTLVPGCDKVTGKALMLDEIINYVQSLQNQVEFLSMKLASANPILYDFGMDPEVYIGRPEILNGMASQLAELPYMPPCNTFQATADAPTTASSLPLITAGNSFIPQENPCPLLLEQEQHGNSCLVARKL